MAKTKKITKKPIESDSTYFLKIVLYMMISAAWVRVTTSSGAEYPLPLGAIIALIFASHNLGQVKRLATRVVYLEQGQVLADLPVQTFFGGTVLQQQYPAAHLFVKGETV